MAAVMTKLACIVLACMVVVVPMTAEAAITCGTVTSKVTPCINYLMKGGEISPACCSGIQGLNSLARTTPDRQQACLCLQNAARGFGSSLDPSRAAALPGACSVSIPYPISLSTNCNNVK